LIVATDVFQGPRDRGVRHLTPASIEHRGYEQSCLAYAIQRERRWVDRHVLVTGAVESPESTQKRKCRTA
jgi:hypothetical protein